MCVNFNKDVMHCVYNHRGELPLSRLLSACWLLVGGRRIVNNERDIT